MIPDEREGVAGKKRHGDFAVALVLAYFAARMRFVEYAYEAANLDRHTGSAGDFMFAGDGALDTRNWWDAPLGSELRGGI
jgi:hypothetical protein